MKISRFIPTILAVSLVTAAVRADDDTPLALEMKGIAKDFRQLHKEINDPAQKDACVQLVKDMEAHAAKAHDLKPAKTKDIPAEQQQQFVADYQKAIDGMSNAFKKLEGQIAAGNTAEATATLDEIQNDKRQGHKKFNAQAGGPGGPGAGGPPPPAS